MATAFDNKLLPVSYSGDARGGPEFATAIVRSGSGGIIAHRNINREDFVSRYEIAYQDLASRRQADLKLFVKLRQGQARAFRFLAPDDSALDRQAVGILDAGSGDLTAISTTNGSTAQFFIIKTYSDPANTYVRRIAKPSPTGDWTITILRNGVTTTGVFPAGYFASAQETLPTAKIINLPSPFGNAALDFNLGKLIF